MSNIKSGRKSELRHLGITLNRSSKCIEVLTEGTSIKQKHTLLYRLYRTNRECFDRVG